MTSLDQDTDVCILCTFHNASIHRDAFIKSPGDFKPVYDSKEPCNTPLPSPWCQQLNELQKMIIVRCLRPDKILPAVTKYVTGKLGKTFVQPPPFDLSKSYLDSNCTIPLVFVLSPGADPMASRSHIVKAPAWRSLQILTLSLHRLTEVCE